MGNAITSPFDLKTPMVSSLPLINSSTKTWSSSTKALSSAACSSSGSFTLLIPILLPPLLGFTKTGNFKVDKMSAVVTGICLKR